MDDLHEIENQIMGSTMDLRRKLDTVQKVQSAISLSGRGSTKATDQALSSVDFSPVGSKDVANVLPTLDPGLGPETRTNLIALTESHLNNSSHPASGDDKKDIVNDEYNSSDRRTEIVEVISRLSRETPLFEDIQMIGLIDSSHRAITVRLKVILATHNDTRQKAMAALRRNIFEVFSSRGQSVSFSEPDRLKIQ